MRLRHKKILVATQGVAVIEAVGKLTGKNARRMARADRAQLKVGGMTYGRSRARLKGAYANEGVKK